MLAVLGYRLCVHGSVVGRDEPVKVAEPRQACRHSRGDMP
jgi:hypothetical protein